MRTLSPELQLTFQRIVAIWLSLWAFCLSISIAATSVVYFPLVCLYFLGAYWTFALWPPTWGRIETLFLIFWGLSILSALFGVNPTHSLQRLGKDLYFLIVILVGALITSRVDTDRLMRIFLWGGLVTASVGILQLVCGVNQTDSSHGVFLNLPTAFTHWPRPLLNFLSLVVGRATGTRSHPLTYAECLLFPIAYVLCLLTDTSKTTKWKSILCLGVLMTALIASQSRGPWIAFLVMGVVLLVLEPRLDVIRKLGWVILIPIVIIVSAPAMRQRAQSITNSAYLSNSERFMMWEVGGRIFKDYPVFGIGPGNVISVSPKYQTTQQNLIFGPWGHLHNTYINIAVERGALGVIAFLIFIATFGGQILGAFRRDQKAGGQHRVIYLTALLSLTGWLVSGITEATYNSSTVLMIFYFVMGIALATLRQSKPPQHS